jgi:hypothetical protein
LSLPEVSPEDARKWAQVSIARRCTKKGTNECLFPQFPAGYHVVIHAMIHTKLSAQSGKIFVVIYTIALNVNDFFLSKELYKIFVYLHFHVSCISSPTH